MYDFQQKLGVHKYHILYRDFRESRTTTEYCIYNLRLLFLFLNKNVY